MSMRVGVFSNPSRAAQSVLPPSWSKVNTTFLVRLGLHSRILNAFLLVLLLQSNKRLYKPVGGNHPITAYAELIFHKLQPLNLLKRTSPFLFLHLYFNPNFRVLPIKFRLSLPSLSHLFTSHCVSPGEKGSFKIILQYLQLCQPHKIEEDALYIHTSMQ